MTDNGGRWTYERIAQGIKASEGHVALIAKLAEEKRLLLKELEEGNLSDGAHTHNELYEHRMWLTIYAIEAWKWWSGFEAVKSHRHADGELCFGGGWFIVMVKLPAGWISYHYEDEYWDLFAVPEAKTPPEYDGHTAADVVDRMRRSTGQVNLANVGQRLAREKFTELEDRIKELEADSRKLAALEAMGVDNWEGYEIALEEMEDD